MTLDDICLTLHELDAVYKDSTGQYSLRFVKKVYQDEIKRIDAKNFQKLKPELLKWAPFLLKRLHQLRNKK